MKKDEVQTILEAHGIRPLPSLSQNFLLHEPTRDRIAEAGHTEDVAHVVEIGGGIGVLTEALVRRFQRVTVFEIDKTLSQILRERFYHTPHVVLKEEDALEADEYFSGLQDPYVVIANIPYHLTNRIIRSVLTGVPQPQSIVLLVQKEVAERLTSDSADYSLFRLSVEMYAHAEYVETVPKAYFYPRPDVDSAVISITPHETFADANQEAVLELAGYAFRQKRKQVRTSLNKQTPMKRENIEHALSACEIPVDARPQDITPAGWCCIQNQLIYPEARELQ